MSSGVLSQIELFVFEKESLKILLQYKIYCIYIYIGFVKEIEMRETGFYRSLSALLFLELLQYRIMYRSHAKFVCVQICCHEDQRQNQPLGLDDTHTQSETTFRQKSEKARRGKDPTVETTTEPLPDELHSQVWWTLLQPFYLEPSHLVFCAVIPQTD